jgi:hypothetical protein
MSDFFKHHRNKDLFFDLSDDRDIERFVKACPEGTVTLFDGDETPDRNIHKLNEKVFVREYLYNTEKL